MLGCSVLFSCAGFKNHVLLNFPGILIPHSANHFLSGLSPCLLGGEGGPLGVRTIAPFLISPLPCHQQELKGRL